MGMGCNLNWIEVKFTKKEWVDANSRNNKSLMYLSSLNTNSFSWSWNAYVFKQKISKSLGEKQKKHIDGRAMYI